MIDFIIDFSLDFNRAKNSEIALEGIPFMLTVGYFSNVCLSIRPLTSSVCRMGFFSSSRGIVQLFLRRL